MTGGSPDRVAVTRRLLALERALHHVSRHQGRPLAALTDDIDEQWAVLHGLQLCAQAALDIATHIAASAGFDAPDYTTAIDRLAELGVLDRPFATRFRAVAGFRNALVHGYTDVDLTIVHAVLNERLADFHEFRAAVARWLG